MDVNGNKHLLKASTTIATRHGTMLKADINIGCKRSVATVKLTREGMSELQLDNIQTNTFCYRV